MSVVLRFSVVKRERQTNLRLACVALERVVVVADDADDDEDSTADGDALRRTRGETSREANEGLLRDLEVAGGELTIVGFWESRETFDPLPALHFLSRDAGGAPSFRCAPSDGCDAEERESIEALHGEMLGENKTAVVQMKGADGTTSELHLVAVPARRASEDGGEESSMTAAMVERARFIAFKTKEMAPAYAMPLLKHNRLVVVLDLDETLVQATTLHALDKRVEKMRGRMVSLMKFDHTNPRASAVMVEEVKKERMACEVALRRLQTDRAMLAQYCVEGAVTLNNRRSVTIPEIESLPNGTQRLKNVIRLPSPHIKGGMMVFTVVNPADPGTAMLVHVRPGWEELRKYLSGQDRQSKRAEVFVCTMANIEYAREMCRILDQHGTVFDPAQLEHRVKSVAPNELKSLSTTCGAHFPTELAVIVDDRTSVWEPEARPHILAVTPFMPYGTDVEFGTTIEQHEARGTGGVLGTAQNMMEALRLRWHMDYEKFAHKARKHVQDTVMHGALRPPPPSPTRDEDAAPTTSRDDALEGEHHVAAQGPADTLRADHARKKAIHLFYPPSAADLLTPLMDAEAKEAALSIAERGGAARAPAGRSVDFPLAHYEAALALANSFPAHWGLRVVQVPRHVLAATSLAGGPSGGAGPSGVPSFGAGVGAGGAAVGAGSSLDAAQLDRWLAPLPPRLRKCLAPFQREGVAFILRNRGRAMLADEMGLGKTVQASADHRRDAPEMRRRDPPEITVIAGDRAARSPPRFRRRRAPRDRRARLDARELGEGAEEVVPEAEGRRVPRDGG